MGIQNLFGQKTDFTAKVKSVLERVQKEAEKDPDTFKYNIAKAEKELGGQKNPVERSVVHALLGSAYREMKWTFITDYDEETCSDYDEKRGEHYSHVLDDMEALANTKVGAYERMLTKGRDSELYGNDMLSVMVDFLVENASLTNEQKAEMYGRAMKVYQNRSNQNGYGLMKWNWLMTKRHVEKGAGNLSWEEYKDSLYQLMSELKQEEVGADLALEYLGQLTSRDEKILFLKWALENIGSSRRKGELKGMQERFLQPHVNVYRRGDVMANRPYGMELNFWNCERATLTIRKYVGRKMTKNGPGELILTGNVVEKKDVVLAVDSVNRERLAKGLPVEGMAETEVMLPAGRYVYVAEGVGDVSSGEITVSTMRIIEMDKDKNTYQLYVVDNETGRPVSGVKVQFRKKLPVMAERSAGWENRGIERELVTGADGVVEVTEDTLYVRAVRNGEDYTDWNHYYHYRMEPEEHEEEVVSQLFTDRSIYRPGQQVQGSVLVYRQLGDEVKVVQGETYTLTMEDAKLKKLMTKELTTNEYGTATFQVDLPEDCEVGMLHWRLDGEGMSYENDVRVEEYKRPTFSVAFDGKQAGHFGEVLEAEGTAMLFAGVPVQGGLVHYTVEYGLTNFKRWWWNTDWNYLTEGDLTTDDEGKFRVPVDLSDEHLRQTDGVMRFRVKATVTDVSGESHEAEWVVNASNREFGLDLKVKDVLDVAKKATFKVEAFDINEEAVDVEGSYTIKNGQQVVSEGTFKSGETVTLPENLKLGVQYALTVTAYEKSGQKVEDSGSFILYNSELPVTEVARWGMGEKRRAESEEPETDFLYSEESTFKEGGAIDLFFTTAETDAYIIYNVYNVDGLLEHQVGVTDGSMKHLRLQYRKEWGESIEVDVLYVRNGHYRNMAKRFELVPPEKQLKLEWATFRDKMQPGQREEWTLTVTDKNGKRVSGAEMMAVLYDASLDQIYSHKWNFWLRFERFMPRVDIVCPVVNAFPTFSLDGKLPSKEGYTREFNRLIGFTHDRYLRRNTRMAFGSAMYMVEESMPMLTMAKAQTDAVDEEDAHTMREVVVKAPSEEKVAPQVNFENATIRENFAETAFFLPHLVSDKKGNVTIQFTLPESLTEWKFMGFVHTKDVDYGTVKATAVARKTFMLRPNMPRFVRWGDQAVVASSIINQSEEALKGAVRMRLLDAETGDVVLVLEKPFEVEADKTVGVDFDFDVKESWKDLDCEIIAMSGNVSDGEKNPLPVLSTKKEMVEAVPYYIIGGEDGAEVTKTMDLGRLFNQNSTTAVNRALKVEYTDNPAWMCIEALRSVKVPAEDDAIDYAASYYANTRLLELMETFPVLKKHEDAEALKQQTEKVEQKLAGLQKSDGGWSWFNGMNSNYYTTLVVCEQLAKFPKTNERVKQMLDEGMKYLDHHELEAYQNAKKRGVKIWPSNSELRYLYLSAQMPERAVDKEVQLMREDYLKKVEKTPQDLTIYGVANAAYTLRAFGHVKSADKLVNFLKDYTVEKPGQGRFYATDAAYYSWMDYRIPTQVAAMKAIIQKDRKDSYLNDMQLWLISQKQVQKWDNPMNTIDVADFLLKVSPMETFHEVKMPVLVVDGHELKDVDYGTINTERDKLEGREANLVLQGNVLADVPETVLEQGVKELEVRKQTPGISWGAAYATFLEDVGNVKAYATDELKIQRKFYVQSTGSEKWMEYDRTQPLKVGDKLRIRHIITADRDMDFVRVSAQHPACLEPVRHLSGYQWMGGRGCYLSIHDSHFDMFFDWFTRGSSTVDMEYSIVRAGVYEVGISTVECVYAKQFGGHTEGQKVDAVRK